MKGQAELARMLFNLMTDFLNSKAIGKVEFQLMLFPEREKNGIPMSYRSYMYLREGKVLFKAPKLAKIAAALNIEIQLETIYFVKKIE